MEDAGVATARRRAARLRKYGWPLYSLACRYVRALHVSGKYLDMGAGSGLLATMLAKEGAAMDITAIDISPAEVAVAREYVEAGRLGDRISCRVGDVYDEGLMRGLGQFDLVYSTFALHHWSDPLASLGNLWNAVAQDGVMYILDFRKAWWTRFLHYRGTGIDADAYPASRIKNVLGELGITGARVETRFPWFMQSVTAWK